MGKELASINLSFAKYYSKRNKTNAALQYMNKALKSFLNKKCWSCIAECHLHKSYILWNLGYHAQAIKHLHKIIHIISSEKLDIIRNKERTLALVTMHNLAAQLYLTGKIGEAFMTIEKALQIEELCMSYGDATIPDIKTTHEICLSKLARSVLLMKDTSYIGSCHKVKKYRM